MNYGVKLLGASISIVYFLRLCGVLGEVTDSRAPEIYADFFATHDVDDTVQGWLLHDNFLATRKAVSNLWNVARIENSDPEDDGNHNNCPLNTFFQYSGTPELIIDNVFAHSFTITYIKSISTDPACYVLQESRKGNNSDSTTESSNSADSDMSGCRLINQNRSLICDSDNLVSIPKVFPRTLELFQINATNLTYLGEYAFGESEIITVKIQGNKINCIHPLAFKDVNVKILYIEDNEIEYIRPEDFVTLTNTSAIFLEHNNISLLKTPWGVSADASNCTTVLPSLTFLSLLGNPLVRIPEDYFCALRQSPVNTLDLTNCHLKSIERGALSYFPNLATLMLGENPFLMDALGAVLEQVKNPSLTKLTLESNGLSRVPTVPLEIVWASLTTLDLSGNLFDLLGPESFPDAQSNLRELNLENCRIRFIHHETFKDMTKLMNLLLNNNRLSSIPWTITHLPRLMLLDMSAQVPPKSSIISIGAPVYTFQIDPEVFSNSKVLKMLDLQHLSQYKVKIGRNTFKHLQNLEYLLLADSSIDAIPHYAFEKLNKLKRLDLSRNELATIQDITFYGLQNLIALYLDFNNLEFPCASLVPDTETITLTEVTTFPDSQYAGEIPTDPDGVPLLTNASIVEPFRYMPKLEELKITNNRLRFVTSRVFQWLPNLHTVDMCGNLFKSWSERLFINGSSVKTLLVSRNNIGYVSTAMLEDMLDVVSRPDSSLDLSENPLVCLPTICSLMELVSNRTLPLLNWDSPSKYMCWDPLDSEYYSLPDKDPSEFAACLSVIVTEAPIDTSSVDSTSRRTTGGISSSKGSTSAATVTTPAAATSTKATTFTTTTTEVNEPRDADEAIGNEKSSSIITFAIVFMSLFSAISLAVVGYKKRFHLKYFWFVVKFNVIHSPNLNLDSMKKEAMTPPNYDYDLFVSYNHSDKEFIENYLVPHVEGSDVESNEDRKSLKICIHERDFKAGVPITENIVDCVDRSRKVVVIVSKNYLESQWCLYEMNLAYHRLIESRRKAFVVVLLEDIPASLRTKSLNYLLLSRTYLEWPGVSSSISEQYIFWKRLRNSLSDLE